jgi:hypothetical protein
VRLIALLLGITPALICAVGETILWEDLRPGMLLKAVVSEAGAFDQVNLSALCRRVLKQHGQRGFIQLQVFQDKRDAHPLPKPDHLLYNGWRRGHDDVAMSLKPVAEMIAIGRSAILRLRDQHGVVSETVLSGKNPLVFESRGSRFEVLHFAFGRPGLHSLERADVYARTDHPLDPEAGLGLLHTFQAMFPDMAVSVFVRNDAWFIYEQSFPFFYPFGEGMEPSSDEAFIGTHTLRCGTWSGSAACSLQ